MTLRETYQFQPTDFDNDGFHKKKEEYLFLDDIRESEKDFHRKHNPYFANAFFANSTTMRLLKLCFHEEDNEVLGMESVDGKVDVEMNLKIEEHSRNATVYAIERFNEADEPLFLVVDDGCSNREFALKYSSDDDSEEAPEDFPIPESKIAQPVTVLQ